MGEGWFDNVQDTVKIATTSEDKSSFTLIKKMELQDRQVIEFLI